MSDIRNTAMAIGAGSIALLLVMVAVGSVVGAVEDTGTDNQTEDVAVTGGTESLGLPLGQSVEAHYGVETSLEDQAKLSGNGQVDVSTDANVGGDKWAVCTWTSAESSVVTNDERRSVLGYEEQSIYYDGTADEWVGYYYDDSNREEYEVRIGHGSPTENQLLCVQRNDSTLTISRNTTTASVSLSNAATNTGPPAATWNGTIEETRLYNDDLNASQRAEWVNEPVLAVSGPAPDLRLTYDVRGTSGTPETYFSGGSVSLAGDATLTSGFSGPAVARGTDYQWGGLDDGQLTILSGSQLEQSGEVLYHRYSVSQFGGIINRVVALGGAALGLLVVGLVLKSTTAILGAFGDGM